VSAVYPEWFEASTVRARGAAENHLP